MYRVIAEESYFATHPTVGEFHFWETMGTRDNATFLLSIAPKSLRPTLVQQMKSWLADRMTERADMFRSMLQKQCPSPSLLSFHLFRQIPCHYLRSLRLRL
jgi:hypothetical protein